METKDMGLKEYCCLNRPRFRVEPETDAEWFFGDSRVSDELLTRVTSDFDIRGVPKCLLFGRFGCGKTHTLHHMKYLFDSEPERYPAVGFIVPIAPYDEGVSNLSGWKYIHGKMLDEMGEQFLRHMVQDFNKLPDSGTGELAEVMRMTFKFGDENLKRSLANVLSGYFLRDMKSTASAWQWLKGSRMDKGTVAEDLGITKHLENAEDMVSVIMNLGNLVRKTQGKGIVFLMDEAQALEEVGKREIEIHHAFLQLADDLNQDVGFVIAYFGDAINKLPDVLSKPPDILSRLGVSLQNLEDAVINLMRLISTKDDMGSFIRSLLEGIKDMEKARKLIDEMGLSDQVSAESLPFTSQALDRAKEMLHQNEHTRNPRMIINQLAAVAARAYHQGKAENRYILADIGLVEAAMQNLK